MRHTRYSHLMFNIVSNSAIIYFRSRNWATPHAQYCTERRVLSCAHLTDPNTISNVNKLVHMAYYITCLTLCIGSTTSPMSSSKLPEIARLSSGPASCSVRSPACNVIWLFFSEAAASCSLRFLNLFKYCGWKTGKC